MGRDIGLVIDDMIGCMPINSPLITKLSAIKTSALYAAPETRLPFWNKISELLEESFPNPRCLEPWQELVIKNFIGPEGVIRSLGYSVDV